MLEIDYLFSFLLFYILKILLLKLKYLKIYFNNIITLQID